MTTLSSRNLPDLTVTILCDPIRGNFQIQQRSPLATLHLRFILNLPRIQKYRHDERYLTVNLFMRTKFVTQLSNLAR